MMLYIILTHFLSSIKKCCLFGHIASACWYVAWTLYAADKGCLYLFVTSLKDSILLNSWLICLINLESEDTFIGLSLRSYLALVGIVCNV